MIVVEYEGVELDHCVQCGGTWFDRDELELLFKGMGEDVRKLLPAQAEKLPEAATREKKRRCPICSKKMNKILIGPRKDILIDVCPRGEGLWFDDTEVAALADEVLGAIPGVPGQAIDFIGRVFRQKMPPAKEEQ
jgi:Zn-finger nucleic acid-binding protein